MRRAQVISIAFACACASPVFAGSPVDRRTHRPKIALALSGGAAYGLTQLGALEWMEEHRIPVDGIAGTSGGAIVGAWYATGLELMTDAEIAHPSPRNSPKDMKLHGIREALDHLDLDRLFRSFPDYRNVDVQDKELQRTFPFGPLAGIHGQNVFLTDGLVPGQSLETLFDRICQNFPREFLYRADKIAPFDHLPTPFRAVAVQPHGYNLKDWEKIALGETDALPKAPGYQVSLPDAIRASMAIPYVFTPRYLPPQVKNGEYQYGLLDGGTRDNFPTDVADDAFHPDVLIGLHILVDLKPLSTVFKLFGHPGVPSVIERESNLFKFGKSQAVRPKAFEVVMDPGLTGPDRFDDWQRLAWLGYKSMERYAATPTGAKLLAYRLSAREYQEFRDARRKITAEAMSFAGRTPDLANKLEAIASKSGSGSVGFETDHEGSELEYHPRGLGDLQLYTSPEFSLGSGQWSTEGVQILARQYEFLNSKSSVNLSLRAGSSSKADLEMNLIPSQGSGFIRPYIGSAEDQQSFFGKGTRGQDRLIPSQKAGVELGVLTASSLKASLSSEIGKFENPWESYRENLLRVDLDTTGSPQNPKQGIRANGMVRQIQTGDTLSAADQAEAGFDWPIPQRAGNHLELQAAGGTSFGAQPDEEVDFRLGGLGLMRGYPADYIRSPGFVYSSLTENVRLERLPFYLGVLHTEIGAEYAKSISGAYTDVFALLEANTRIGNLSAGISLSDHYRPRVFLGLGTAREPYPGLFGFAPP